MELAPGDVVSVPLGAREVTAVVWADNATPEPRLHNRLKDVADKIDVPPLRAELRSFVDWVAGYTLSSRGMVLRMTLRMGENLGPERLRVGVRLAGPAPKRMTPARSRVISLLRDGPLRLKSEAAQEAGVSIGVIDGLIDEGTLETIVLPPDPVMRRPDPDFAPTDFSPEQEKSAQEMRDSSPPTNIRSRCSTASRVRARRKSISKRWRRRSGADGRRSFSCRRSR